MIYALCTPVHMIVQTHRGQSYIVSILDKEGIQDLEAHVTRLPYPCDGADDWPITVTWGLVLGPAILQ